MSMGRQEGMQGSMWISHNEIQRGAGHRFYEKLNELLREAGFDRKVEALCAPYFDPDGTPGRKSIAPEVYFRMHLIGYFEGIESERGIEWRCADSLSLRDFLGLELTERVPDHSTLSRMRMRLPLEVHQQAVVLILGIVERKGLLRELKEKGYRTYIPERRQAGKRRWTDKGGRDTAVACYDNRARVKRKKGRGLQRKRGELLERTFAHICETGGARRTRLRGRENVRKRYLIADERSEPWAGDAQLVRSRDTARSGGVAVGTHTGVLANRGRSAGSGDCPSASPCPHLPTASSTTSRRRRADVARSRCVIGTGRGE